MSFTPVRIALKSPVMHGEEEIKELVFAREMVAGDLRGVSLTNMTHDGIWEVASRLTGVPASVIRQLKIQDYMDVAEVVAVFFGVSLPTGGTE